MKFHENLKKSLAMGNVENLGQIIERREKNGFEIFPDEILYILTQAARLDAVRPS